jgi:hypothetical protein
VLTGPIYQVTLKAGSLREFHEPGDYVGTSMAAAHVSGVAALVLASGVIPRNLRHRSEVPKRVLLRLARTSRDLGLSKLQQGGGLIDAALATNTACNGACLLAAR